jgi:hypothetical protein
MAREFFYSICAILDMPLLDGVWGDADEGSGLWEGVAASERGEGVEASGNVAVEFVGRAFLFREPFSSAYRCSSCVCDCRISVPYLRTVNRRLVLVPQVGGRLHPAQQPH